MAPSPGRDSHWTIHQTLAMEKRGLGSSSPMNNHFSKHQIYIAQSVALTSASISIFCAVIAFYWFIRMRKSFRHHLIMLLIQSDMFKSLWYLIFPAVIFTRGPVQSSSTFCQVYGFFLSVGIEASDFAILMIAVHSALHIFKPTTSMGEAGLYSYRYFAYACWIIYPILMASLAFVNPDHGYMSQGTFCYLPVRPFWYRLALSWIPRYVIIISITILYLAIYLYVRIQFKNFDSHKRDSYKIPTGDLRETDEPVKYNGRVDSATGPSMPSSPTLSGKGLTLATDSELGSGSDTRKNSSNRGSIPGAPAWENYTFGGSMPLQIMAQGASETESINPIPPDMEIVHSRAAPPSNLQRTATTSTSNTLVNLSQALRDDRISTSVPTFKPVFPAPFNRLNGPVNDGTADSPSDSSEPRTSNRPDRTSLQQRHTAIKRSLRFLFIYPVVYTLMWIIPFASHCLQYSDHYSTNPPFILNCFVTGILSLQCAVDCILFSTREKPWRYIKGSDGTFWGSFTVWEHDLKIGRESGLFGSERLFGDRDTGKSRTEMIAEARAARERRDLEMEGMRKEWETTQRKRKESLDRRGGRLDRSWWEVEGRQRADSVLLGTDGPTAEENGGITQPKHEETILEEGEEETEDRPTRIPR